MERGEADAGGSTPKVSSFAINSSTGAGDPTTAFGRSNPAMTVRPTVTDLNIIFSDEVCIRNE